MYRNLICQNYFQKLSFAFGLKIIYEFILNFKFISQITYLLARWRVSMTFLLKLVSFLFKHGYIRFTHGRELEAKFQAIRTSTEKVSVFLDCVKQLRGCSFREVGVLPVEWIKITSLGLQRGELSNRLHLQSFQISQSFNNNCFDTFLIFFLF